MDEDRKVICRVISEMLDNPDNLGIYDTTKAFNDLEYYIEKVRREAMYNTADYDPNTARSAMVEHQARIFMEMFNQPYDEAYENAERMIPKDAGNEQNWD